MPKSIYVDENGNERILSSSPSALSGLLDTDITTPSANQVLSYDGSKWGNVTLTTSDISDYPTDSGWINLPLASGVSNYGDNVSQYRKIGNVVHYYILVEKSGLGWGSQVATLPTGYRPNQEATSSGRYGNGICNFSVQTNGNILFLASTNTSTTDYRFFACGSFCI